MNRISSLALALCVLFLSSSAFAAEPGWLTSWDEAARKSKTTGKPILMNFTGSDWCGWCIKLKKEVFSTPEFQSWAAKKVVLLEVDFPRRTELDAKTLEQNKKLAEKFGIQGYPTIVFANAKGEQLGTSGYQEGGPAAWTKSAEQQMKKK